MMVSCSLSVHDFYREDLSKIQVEAQRPLLTQLVKVHVKYVWERLFVY